MRLVCVGCLALSALAQINLPSGAPPATRPAQRVNHLYRGGYGYWGGGYYGGGGYWGAPHIAVRPVLPPPEPQAPILASSSLYQADRANPVMREYGALPAANRAVNRVALVALTDGSAHAVWAYWLEGDQLAFVTVGDASHKVPISRLDRDRTEKLNRQQGVDFHLGKP